MSKKEKKELDKRVKALVRKGVEASIAELWARTELEERRGYNE